MSKSQGIYLSTAIVARQSRKKHSAKNVPKITKIRLGLLKGMTGSGSFYRQMLKSTDSCIKILTLDRCYPYTLEEILERATSEFSNDPLAVPILKNTKKRLGFCDGTPIEFKINGNTYDFWTYCLKSKISFLRRHLYLVLDENPIARADNNESNSLVNNPCQDFETRFSSAIKSVTEYFLNNSDAFDIHAQDSSDLLYKVESVNSLSDELKNCKFVAEAELENNISRK